MIPMARVTIEDCLEKVDNRFELVVLAAERARTIQSGDVSKIKKAILNCHNTALVLALREIASGYLNLSVLKENILKRYRMNKRFNSLVTVSFGDSADLIKQEGTQNISGTEEVEFDSDAFTVSDSGEEGKEFK